MKYLLNRRNTFLVLAWLSIFALSGCDFPVTQRERKTSFTERSLNAKRRANESKQTQEPAIQQMQNPDPIVQEQLQAIADARRDPRLDFNHRKWGCMGGLGPTGLAAAAIHEPAIPLHKLQGKSDVYILYYKEEYVKEMKRYSQRLLLRVG